VETIMLAPEGGRLYIKVRGELAAVLVLTGGHQQQRSRGLRRLV
jgi:hypothetical protein